MVLVGALRGTRGVEALHHALQALVERGAIGVGELSPRIGADGGELGAARVHGEGVGREARAGDGRDRKRGLDHRGGAGEATAGERERGSK